MAIQGGGGAGEVVIKLVSLWGDGKRGRKGLLAHLSTDVDLPVSAVVSGVHTVMKGASCLEETHEQVDAQLPEVTDSGGWPCVCSSGARSGLVWWLESRG